MRIVVLRSNPVRPDSRVEKEVYSLSKAGHEVSILCWDRDKDHSLSKEHLKVLDVDVPIFRQGYSAGFGLGFKSLFPFVKFQMSIAKWLIIHRHEYDAIHACDFDTAFTASKINIFLNKKLIFDIFDFLYDKPENIFQRIIKHCQYTIINKSSATVICTEDRRRQIKGSKPKVLSVVHNTPMNNMVIERNEESNTSDKVTVCYVGILQDFRLLLEIADYFTKHRNIEWHVGGFGKYEDYFIGLSRKYSNIVFHGRIPYKETLELEQSCDIMLAIYDPSIDNHVYAAPNKFYESLMLGKPVIMVKGTGMSDVVVEKDIGVLIEYTEEGFSEGIDTLISRKQDWSNISERMRQLYRDEYNWDIMDQRLVSLYKQI